MSIPERQNSPHTPHHKPDNTAEVHGPHTSHSKGHRRGSYGFSLAGVLSRMSASSTHLREDIVKQRRMILVAGGLVLTSVLGWWGYQNYAERRERTASDAFFALTQKADTTLDAWQTFAKSHKGTVAGYQAWLRAGDQLYAQNSFDKAAVAFRDAADAAPSKTLKLLALHSQAVAHESAGQMPEAAKTYQHALQLGETWLKLELLMGQGRALEASGDKDKAKAVYDTLLKEFPNAPAAKALQARLKDGK